MFFYDSVEIILLEPIAIMKSFMLALFVLSLMIKYSGYDRTKAKKIQRICKMKQFLNQTGH